MGSSTVKAQQIANEANLRMNTENNETQKQLASEANALQYQMFNEQNQWNLDRRNEEWAYNDPSAQMTRMIQAGVNPIIAAGNISAGEAQQLTSANAPEVKVASTQAGHVDPEINTNFGAALQGLTGIASNMSNSALGFYKLALENQDVQTRKSAQQSQAALNSAEAAFKRSQTQGQDLFNNLNYSTFNTQVSTKVAEYDRLLKEVNNLDKESSVKDAILRNLNATRDQITAQTNYVQMQTDHYIETLRQRWAEIAIAGRNASANELNAETASKAQATNEQRLQVDVDRYTKELQSKTNDQILDYLKLQANPMHAAKQAFQGLRDTVNGWFGYPAPDRVASELEAAGVILKDRFIKDPSEQNKNDYDRYLNFIYSLPVPQLPSQPYSITPSSVNVLNPSRPE